MKDRLSAVLLLDQPFRLSTSDSNNLGAPNRALRNHHIAVGHLLGEARPTKTQEVTAAGGAADQIIRHYGRNKANEAVTAAAPAAPDVPVEWT